MMILDIVTSACLMDFFVTRLCSLGLEYFKKFYGRYRDLIEKYQRSVRDLVNDSFSR